MPPVFEKAFSPPTVPHAMSTPVLAAQPSLPVQTPPTSLLQRMSQTCTPSPIAPEIDTPPQGSPVRTSSPGVSLGTEDLPITHTNVATTLGKRKEGPAQEDDATMEKVLTQTVSDPKNNVNTRPAPQPASPLQDHHRPTCPIQVLDQIPSKEKEFPRPTGLLLISGPVSHKINFPNGLGIFSKCFLSSAIVARR